MDDIYGATEEEHDRCLGKVMQCIETAGLKLNHDKCSIRQSQLRFLWHLTDQSGIRPDHNKVEAIQLSRKIHPQPLHSRTAAL